MLVGLQAYGWSVRNIGQKVRFHLRPVVVNVILGKVKVALHRAAFDMYSHIGVIRHQLIGRAAIRGVVNLIVNEAVTRIGNLQAVHTLRQGILHSVGLSIASYFQLYVLSARNSSHIHLQDVAIVGPDTCRVAKAPHRVVFEAEYTLPAVMIAIRLIVGDAEGLLRLCPTRISSPGIIFNLHSQVLHGGRQGTHGRTQVGVGVGSVGALEFRTGCRGEELGELGSGSCCEGCLLVGQFRRIHGYRFNLPYTGICICGPMNDIIVLGFCTMEPCTTIVRNGIGRTRLRYSEVDRGGTSRIYRRIVALSLYISICQRVLDAAT